MGLQYPYRDCSFNLSIRIRRSVNGQSIVASLGNFNSLPLDVWILSGIPMYSMGEMIYCATGNNCSISATTGIALSITVNALVMGLIVFKTIKVFREVNPTSDERNLGVTHRSTLRSAIFVLIESGMILFSIQFLRLVIGIADPVPVPRAYSLFVAIQEMFNVIIRSDISTFHFTDNVAILGYNTYNHPGAGVNGILFP